MRQGHELEGEAYMRVVALLPGRDPDERGLVLGEVGGQGWLMSLGTGGAMRWQTPPSALGDGQILTAARLHGRDDLLAVGTRARGADRSESWWGVVIDPGPAARIEQGKFEIEGADAHQALDAIVGLGERGFVGLGRAWREVGQPHEQVIAVGFDVDGQPTWSRVLEYIRAVEVYRHGAVNPKLPGAANFVARVPVGVGGDRSALAWLEINPGVDGILVLRQLAGTEGWASAGFIEGREVPAISTVRQGEAGLD